MDEASVAAGQRMRLLGSGDGCTSGCFGLDPPFQ